MEFMKLNLLSTNYIEKKRKKTVTHVDHFDQNKRMIEMYRTKPIIVETPIKGVYQMVRGNQ